MKVLFYRENFLNKSETFISNYIRTADESNVLQIHFLAHNVDEKAIAALNLQNVNVINRAGKVSNKKSI